MVEEYQWVEQSQVSAMSSVQSGSKIRRQSSHQVIIEFDWPAALGQCLRSWCQEPSRIAEGTTGRGQK